MPAPWHVWPAPWATAPADAAAPSVTPLADGWNVAAEARFRAERPAEVAALEAARLARQLPGAAAAPGDGGQPGAAIADRPSM
jgi:hypothetical protein